MLRERPRMDYADYEMKLKSRRKNAEGHEVPDPTPMAPPVGYKEFPSMIETVQKMVRDYHLQKELAAQGAETFEEANDFDVDEEGDLISQYEVPDEDDFTDPTLPVAIDRGSLPSGEGKGQGEKTAGSPADKERSEGEGHATPASDGGGSGVARPTPPSTSKR